MPIKITEITKDTGTNAVGNVTIAYDITNDKGLVIKPESSVVSVNYDTDTPVEIAKVLFKDAMVKEYDVIQNAKVDKFDTAILQVEINKLISAKAIEVVK